MSKLVRWNTPFTDGQFPSVVLRVVTGANDLDVLKAIVAPRGLDKYPKYLVDFGEVVAFTCFEEVFAPKRDFPLEFVDKNVCAYEYIKSPWLESYEAWEIIDDTVLHHYVIFGGDNNIEVITPNIPLIDTVAKKTLLEVRTEI